MASASLALLARRVASLADRERELPALILARDEEMGRARWSPAHRERERAAAVLAPLPSETHARPDLAPEESHLAHLACDARYAELLAADGTPRELLAVAAPATTPWREELDRRARALAARSPHHAFETLLVGASLLQVFVQANWTGPPPDVPYPLPLSADQVASLELAYRDDALRVAAALASAASGKTKTAHDVDAFPGLRKECAESLDRFSSGETLHARCALVQYLDAARVVLLAVRETAAPHTLETASWWCARLACVHHESLATRDVAEELHARARAEYADALARVPAEYHGRLHLELGVAMHKIGDAAGAKRSLQDAVRALGLRVELSGALGRRTKYQTDKAQLVLLASSATTAPASASPRPEPAPRDLAHESDFGTIQEVGLPVIRIEELDKSTPLRERMEVQGDSTELRGHLSLVDQCAVLALCGDVKRSAAWMENLTAEELLAYVNRATEHPDNWAIHATALLTKSKLEFEKYKTKERSVLQMQALVDQQTTRLTPLQYRAQDVREAESTSPRERLAWVHALEWPPVWRLKRGLADRYKELGVMGSALELFEELQMWEDAAACLVAQDKRARAETMLRTLLEAQPSPSVACALGDLLEDDAFLERAWEMSNRRYARAKRLLGASAYKRGDMDAAKRHLVDALEVNGQFPWAWFRLGAAAMRTKDWAVAKRAYSRVVSLEPEDGDAWANLSTALVQLGETSSALWAITEATKHANLNWRIWDSYLTLALANRKTDEAMHAMEVLIDLGERRADGGGKDVDPRALLDVVHGLLELRDAARRGDGDAEFAERAHQRFLRLVAKIKAKTESKADVWAILAHYFGKVGDVGAVRDAALRRCRALMRGEAWIEDAATVKSLCATTRTLLAATPRDAGASRESQDAGTDARQAAADASETDAFVVSVLERFRAVDVERRRAWEEVEALERALEGWRARA